MLRRPHRFRSRTLTPSRNTPIFRHISKVFCRMFQFYCKFDLFMLFLFLDDIPFFCHDFFARNLMKARDPMKKRLISLLLAVAMMVAVVPVSVFADETTSTANSDLRINANGIPYNVSDKAQNLSNQNVSGNGWKYTHETYLSWLDLGVDSSGNALSGNPVAFKFTNPTSSSCAVNIYNASLSDSTTNSTVRVYSPDVTVTNCVFNINLHIMSSVSAPAVVKNCIFTNPSYAISGSHTLDGWNIFANNPGTTNNKYAIHVTNGGRITKLKVGNTEVAMNTADLYVVGKHEIDDDLKLTLDDGTVRTILKSEIANGASTDLPKHIPLTITEEGKPKVDGMDSAAGYFCSDDWTYDSSSAPENCFPIHLRSNFSGPVGPYPVKLKVNNEGTITDGIFLNEVSGNGKITGGIFLQEPTGADTADVHTLTAGNNGNGTFTKLTIGGQSVDLNTNELYVVGTLTSELTVAVKNNYETTYNFVIPAGSLTTDLALDTLYSTGSKKLEIKADGTPDTSGAFYYYHSSYPNDRTYFGDGWHYYATNSPGKSTLSLNDSFNLGSTPITVNVYNNATLTGGIIAKGATLTTQGTIQNVVVYGTLSTYSQAHIENCILLNKPEYSFSPIIQDCIIVNDPGNWMKKAITATDGAKITTIQLGDLTMTLDEPVSEIYFLPANSDSAPKKLTVTLDDGTEYENIDLEQTVITLAPTKRDDPTTYYSVTVEGGEARNERGDILDSEVALTAGEKITLKLLDETQGEMVFSHWDVNNNDTDLADELAKTGFDKTAHETTFTMPAHNLTLTAKYRMPDEDAPQDDSFLMTAAAVTGGAVLTGLVVWQGYNIFSQVYLNAHLPEGTAIPTNRQQLALLLWNTAGRPEASAASYVFPDVADPDVQTAARWAAEQGLLKARKDGTFAPTDSVTTGQVYRAWQKVK